MQVLADTGVWFRFVRRLPLPKKIETTLTAGETQRYLCPISSMEIIRKWQSGKLPCPDPQTWLDRALEGFEILPITTQRHGIELWHTDTLLEKLTGFPHRYFKGKGL